MRPRRADDNASETSWSTSAHHAGRPASYSKSGCSAAAAHPKPTITISPTLKQDDQSYPSPERLVGLAETPAQAWKLARSITPTLDDCEATAKALMSADVHAQLSTAVRMGDAERARELLSTGVADPSTQSRGTGVSLLTAAVCADDVAVARVLLLHGKFPPSTTPSTTPFLPTARRNEQE
jgi:hypothetical protein